MQRTISCKTRPVSFLLIINHPAFTASRGTLIKVKLSQRLNQKQAFERGLSVPKQARGTTGNADVKCWARGQERRAGGIACAHADSRWAQSLSGGPPIHQITFKCARGSLDFSPKTERAGKHAPPRIHYKVAICNGFNVAIFPFLVRILESGRKSEDGGSPRELQILTSC